MAVPRASLRACVRCPGRSAVCCVAAVRRLALVVFLGGLLASVVACSAGSSATPLPVPSGALVVRAVNTTFQPSQLSAAAGQPFKLSFDNADNLPHNVVLLGTGDVRVFAGDIFTG